MSWDDDRVRDHVRHLEQMLGRLDEHAGRTVRALVELYGEALERVQRIAASAGADAALTGDELINHLLLLHGLHPDPPEVRVGRALGAMESYLAGHRTTVEVAGIDGAAVQLVIAAEGRTAPAGPVRDAVVRAVRAAAPELDRVDVQAPAPEPVLIPLDRLRSRV
ncbi:NifU family protein [Actinomadura graeca]|uniref:NifU family protein n=1 Tax=Actinomadura graeca TaxID=2750812 RepID=A0ABX8QZR2_9ACTN|nr:hypothetical protein [Actinomadura graeca]QXJ24299.1 NifU family protein [Actinomadura graeca]